MYLLNFRMCKCLQYYLESCYWHLIEERFCFDDSIALYEVPSEKEEKNNNFFDNLAFYDSVSVIAGRAIVTIDPLPEKEHSLPKATPPHSPIIEQPRRLRFNQDEKPFLSKEYKSKSVPTIYETSAEDSTPEPNFNEPQPPHPKPELEQLSPLALNLPEPVELRRKTLRERRMSKSLYLKIDQPKELPIIRQQSMPKFYLDTPDEANQAAMFAPSSALSPVPQPAHFAINLHKVVQMERERAQAGLEAQVQRKESERASTRFAQITKTKLRRVKSSIGSLTNLPHSHHHM